MEPPHRSGEKRRHDHGPGHGTLSQSDHYRQRHLPSDDRNGRSSAAVTSSASAASSPLLDRANRLSGGNTRDIHDRRPGRSRDAASEDGRSRYADQARSDWDMRPHEGSQQRRQGSSWLPDARSRDSPRAGPSAASISSSAPQGGNTRVDYPAGPSPRAILSIKGGSEAAQSHQGHKQKPQSSHPPRVSSQGTLPRERSAKEARPHPLFAAARAAASDLSTTSSLPSTTALSKSSLPVAEQTQMSRESRENCNNENGMEDRSVEDQSGPHPHRSERSSSSDISASSGESGELRLRQDKPPLPPASPRHPSQSSDTAFAPDDKDRQAKKQRLRDEHRGGSLSDRIAMGSDQHRRPSRYTSPPERRGNHNTSVHDERRADHGMASDRHHRSRSPVLIRDRRGVDLSHNSRAGRERSGESSRDSGSDFARGYGRSYGKEEEGWRDRQRDIRSDVPLPLRDTSSHGYDQPRRRSRSTDRAPLSPPKRLRRIPGSVLEDMEVDKSVEPAREGKELLSAASQGSLDRPTLTASIEPSRSKEQLSAVTQETSSRPTATASIEPRERSKKPPASPSNSARASQGDTTISDALTADTKMSENAIADRASQASASSPSSDVPAPPPVLEATPPPPPTVQKKDSPAVNRRREVRTRLKPLRERVFVGCSEASAYEKIDESKGGLLGVGTFGEVSRARHIASGADVALKKIKIQANEAQNGMPITAIREIKLLKSLSHPNVCPVVDMVYEPPSETFVGSGTVYMVLPYMEHDLNGLIERLDSEDKPFTPAQIKLYAKQLFEGTLYLHQNKILHRDIKAANILISNDGSLRIADFGLARPYHDPGAASGRPAWRMTDKGLPGWEGGTVNYTGMVVTRWYRPPELLAGERRYGPAVDMWGLGCLLAEMIVRRPIFKGSSEINQLELIVDLCGTPADDVYPGWSALPGVKNVDNTGQIKADKTERGRHDFGRKPRCIREKFMGMVRSELADLIDRLLVLDPRKRLTAEGALAHKWFDVEPLPADPASLPQYPESKEATKGQKGGMQQQQQQQQQQQSQRGGTTGTGPITQQQIYSGMGAGVPAMGRVNPPMAMMPMGARPHGGMGQGGAGLMGTMPLAMGGARVPSVGQSRGGYAHHSSARFRGGPTMSGHGGAMRPVQPSQQQTWESQQRSHGQPGVAANSYQRTGTGGAGGGSGARH